MNDADRREWIENDGRLYRWWVSTNLGIRAFIRRYRAEISAHIEREMNRPPRTRQWYDVGAPE